MTEPCFASGEELRRALPNNTQGDWEALADWPGHYLTVGRVDRATTVFGDVVARVPVFYLPLDDGVLWGTSASVLADRVGEKPDLIQLALDMVMKNIPPFGGRAPYGRVEAVPPGLALRIRQQGPDLVRWLKPRAPVTFKQAALDIRGLLPEGIRRRAELAQKLSADMGGTDSAILAALASLLRDTLGITYVENPETTDLEHGDRVVQALQHLERVLLEPDPATAYFAGLDGDLPGTDLPSVSVLTSAHDGRILQVARDAGSTDHFCAVGGDEALTVGLEALPNRVRSGHPLSAVRAAVSLGRWEGTSPMKAIAALVRAAARSYERAIEQSVQTIREGGIGPAYQLTNLELLGGPVPTVAASWLTRDARAEVARRVEQLADRPSPSDDPAVAREIRGDWDTSRRLAGYHNLARGLGVTVHAPWRDNWLRIRAHSLPEWEREHGGHGFKPLARAAFAELLPAVVTERTGKDRLGINATRLLGMHTNAGALRDIVGSSQLIAEGIFDRDLVSESLELMISNTLPGDEPVRKLLATELWLRDRPRGFW